MELEELFDQLSSIHPVSPSFREAIENELNHLSLPKGYLLLEAPRISDHIYYLQSGFAITYSYVNAEKRIDGLWKPSQVILSVKSFFEQVPAHEYIELVQPSELVCMSYASLMKLFNGFQESNYIYRVLMNQHYERCRERINELQSHTAADRYKRLLSTYPGIEQIMPQENIASFIGITPQSLSRIKRLSP